VTDDSTGPVRPRRRLGFWIGAGVLALMVFVAGVVASPFIFPSDTGLSGQSLVVEGFPTTMTATGDDGRTRSISVTAEDGGEPPLGELSSGDRLVVTGDGFDSRRGIYVAICQVPARVDVRPGPCLGGVPELDTEGSGSEAVEWAPSNWINQQWAWRLFGARSYDDANRGTFRAFILVPPASEEGLDCVEVQCGLFTRNDHTALDNRMQDLYLPVRFSQ
jgi:hypothetical protein